MTFDKLLRFQELRNNVFKQLDGLWPMVSVKDTNRSLMIAIDKYRDSVSPLNALDNISDVCYLILVHLKWSEDARSKVTISGRRSIGRNQCGCNFSVDELTSILSTLYDGSVVVDRFYRVIREFRFKLESDSNIEIISFINMFWAIVNRHPRVIQNIIDKINFEKKREARLKKSNKSTGDSNG